jgi:hypothetical protein
LAPEASPADRHPAVEFEGEARKLLDKVVA